MTGTFHMCLFSKVCGGDGGDGGTLVAAGVWGEVWPVVASVSHLSVSSTCRHRPAGTDTYTSQTDNTDAYTSQTDSTDTYTSQTDSTDNLTSHTDSTDNLTSQTDI